MGGSIGAHRDPRMGTAEDHMEVVVTHRGADLVKGPAGEKDAVGGHEGHLPPQSQPCGGAHQVLLADAYIIKMIGVPVMDPVGAGGGGHIGVQHHHVFPGGAQVQ